MIYFTFGFLLLIYLEPDVQWKSVKFGIHRRSKETAKLGGTLNWFEQIPSHRVQLVLKQEFKSMKCVG